MSAQKTRDQIDNQYKWRMEDIYSTEELWYEELEFTKKILEECKQLQGKLGESSDNLLKYLKLEDKVSYYFERVYIYAHQKYDENTTSSKYQELLGKADAFETAVSSTLSFAIPEILEIPDETLNEFLAKNEELKFYDFKLKEIVRSKAHRLSAEMEELLANASELGEAPKSIFSKFNNADSKFPQIKNEDGELVDVTHSRYTLLLESEDQRVRRDAFKSMYSYYEGHRNTLGAIYIANLKQEYFKAKTRKYPSALERALDGDNVPVAVYKNLIKAVHDNLPKMYRYVELRKKLLGVDELHMYDVYAPMVKGVDMKIPYEEAKDMVLEGLKPLGEEYLEKLKLSFNEGWIDVYENEGKRSGAYSWGPYGTHPYVLLNYQDNLDNVFTLAHELGHALHSYHSNEALSNTYAGYIIFTAEVASTCNEALLMDDLLKKTTDKKEKAYLINHFLEQFRGTVFRQTMFAEFEMIVHEKVAQGESLTTEALCNIYRGLIEKYFGPSIIIDKEIEMEWARIPHFYNAFYVYQYATGFSAAIALSRKILNEGKPAVDAYINSFLSAGGSDYAIEILKNAGVDMSSTKPVNDALELFGELISQLEELVSDL